MHIDRRLLIERRRRRVTALASAFASGLADDRRCRTERFRSVAGGQRGGFAGSELGVEGDDPIRQEFAEPALRPASDEEARDQMEVATRVDVVLDAGRESTAWRRCARRRRRAR